MGFGGLGMWEVLLILFVVLLVFGAKRIPEIGSAMGKGIREFKRSVQEIEGELSRPVDEERDSIESRPSTAEDGGGSEPTGGDAPREAETRERS